jgi:ANTAR domain
VEGTALRIENSSRAHAESLHRALAEYQTDLVQQDGSWRVEVELGELTDVLLELFDRVGVWFDSERVDSLLLSFGERQYTLLRPSTNRVYNSNAFLLERCAHLETALSSRIVIEQANGILASALSVSVEQAFDVLRQTARNRGVTLRELAGRIAATPAQAEAILAGEADA